MRMFMTIYRKVIQLLRFCRKFIMGDDWMATAIIAWGVALVYVLSRHYFINAWFLLPIIVAMAFVASTGNVVYAKRVGIVGGSRSFLLLWGPMMFVTVIPAIVFYDVNDFVSLRGLVIPVIISNTAFASLASACLAKQFDKRPLGSSIAAVAISIVLVSIVQPWLLGTNSGEKHLYNYIIAVCYGLLVVIVGRSRRASRRVS